MVQMSGIVQIECDSLVWVDIFNSYSLLGTDAVKVREIIHF